MADLQEFKCPNCDGKLEFDAGSQKMKCPFCDGTGVIKQSLVVVDEIESNLRYLVTAQNERKVTIVVHPYVEAYLTKGLFSQVWRWRRKFKMRIKIVPSESTALTEHRFLNTQGEEIKL